jgi:hypothetical protein
MAGSGHALPWLALLVHLEDYSLRKLAQPYGHM